MNMRQLHNTQRKLVDQLQQLQQVVMEVGDLAGLSDRAAVAKAEELDRRAEAALNDFSDTLGSLRSTVEARSKVG